VLFRRASTAVSARALTAFARKLEREVAGGRPFDCLISGDAELRRLNQRFRAIDAPTDVLSFPAEPSPGAARMGDLAISLARARSQARRFGHSIQDEIRVLMLHGVLHLLGMDHENDGGRMARAERRWRSRLGLPSSLTERVAP
jgi:probable rRNA maturation factor